MTKKLVYVYKVIVDGVTRYIGKGRGDRLNSHLKMAKKINLKRSTGEKINASLFYNRLAKAERSGAIIESRIIARFVFDESAFNREIEEILKLKNQLWNVKEGGEGYSSADLKRMWSDPEYREHMEIVRADKNVRKRISKSLIEKWLNDSEFRTRMKKSNRVKEPSVRKKISKSVKELFQDPQYRENHATAMEKVRAKPEYREALSRGISVSHAKSSFIKKQSKKAKEKWKDPEYIARRAAAFETPEFRAKVTAPRGDRGHWFHTPEGKSYLAFLPKNERDLRGRSL